MDSNPSNSKPDPADDKSKPPEPRPWPLSWVVIAILVYLLFQVGYILWK